MGDPEVIEAVTSRLADAELLIADGHHRYETARVYAEEVGGEGDHDYTLMCLVSLDDPGLTVFGYHRLLGGFTGTDRPEVLAHAIREHFEVEEVDEATRSTPPARRAWASSATSTRTCAGPSGCG